MTREEFEARVSDSHKFLALYKCRTQMLSDRELIERYHAGQFQVRCHPMFGCSAPHPHTDIGMLKTGTEVIALIDKELAAIDDEIAKL